MDFQRHRMYFNEKKIIFNLQIFSLDLVVLFHH
jgi:hypothetical protein